MRLRGHVTLNLFQGLEYYKFYIKLICFIRDSETPSMCRILRFDFISTHILVSSTCQKLVGFTNPTHLICWLGKADLQTEHTLLPQGAREHILFGLYCTLIPVAISNLYISDDLIEIPNVLPI